MMLHKIIGSLDCAIAVADSTTVYYLIMPMTVADAKLEYWAKKYGSSIAVLSGMDWDNDLTPWTAAGVPDPNDPFKGLAPQFLTLIKSQVMPAVEAALPQKPTKSNLCGISLSGLFALWAWMQDDTFANIGSISGSFWYDGFLSWLHTSIKPKSGFAYFSLGNKEGGSGVNSAFRDIQTQTRRVVEMLRSAGISDEFQQTQGNHYSDPVPRIEAMFTSLSSHQ